MARVSAVIITLLFMAGMGFAEETSLTQLLEASGTWFQWNSFRKTGIVWKGTRSLAFRVGDPLLLVDFSTLYTTASIYQEEGRIVFPAESVAVFRDVFPFRGEGIDGASVVAIFIDPGHGGKDPGAVSTTRNGELIQEKDIVLQVALDLSNKLSSQYPQKQVILSRDDDQYISLEQRITFANSIHLERGETMLFISLHANAALNKKARGFEVWYLPPQVVRKNVADPEELSSADPDVLSVLNILRDEELTVESVLLARSILSALDFSIGSASINRGLREESWYVVRNAKVPAVLLELGFITNFEEQEMLMNSEYLQRLSTGVYQGIADFIQSIEGE